MSLRGYYQYVQGADVVRHVFTYLWYLAKVEWCFEGEGLLVPTKF